MIALTKTQSYRQIGELARVFQMGASGIACNRDVNIGRKTAKGFRLPHPVRACKTYFKESIYENTPLKGKKRNRLDRLREHGSPKCLERLEPADWLAKRPRAPMSPPAPASYRPPEQPLSQVSIHAIYSIEINKSVQ